jgi:peptidoglycan/xylan/chitin deacetylase (PgdA/CDA1 family)
MPSTCPVTLDTNIELENEVADALIYDISRWSEAGFVNYQNTEDDPTYDDAQNSNRAKDFLVRHEDKPMTEEMVDDTPDEGYDLKAELVESFTKWLESPNYRSIVGSQRGNLFRARMYARDVTFLAGIASDVAMYTKAWVFYANREYREIVDRNDIAIRRGIGIPVTDEEWTEAVEEKNYAMWAHDEAINNWRKIDHEFTTARKNYKDLRAAQKEN